MENVSVEELVRATVKEVINELGVDFTKVHFLLDVLEGSISLVKHHEDIMSGKITPAKKNVEDEVIVSDYKNGMSCKLIGIKYGMTVDGVRKRLRKLKEFVPNKTKETT
jgi:hypothetical protein